MRRSLPKPRLRTTATGGRKIAIRIRTNLFTILELRVCGSATLTVCRVPNDKLNRADARNKARLIRNRRTVPVSADPQNRSGVPAV